jgi:hypothetical protein
VIRDTLTAAGLESGEASEFKIRLREVKSLDSTTNIWLDRYGLLENGKLKKPLLVAVQTGGKLMEMTDNLIIRFDRDRGDLDTIPVFEIGYRGESGFNALTSFALSSGYGCGLTAYQPAGRETKFVNLEKYDLGLKLEHRLPAEAADREASVIFGATLPEEERFLFNKSGWLRTEEELGPLIEFMSRRVDLSKESLSASEKERFTEALVLLRNNAIAINDWLGNEFNLVEDVNKHLTLDGDIDGEALRLTDPEHPSLKGTIICIRNILLPKPNSEVVWTNLVRPKADSLTGTLKIIIYSDGSFVGKVTDGVVEQKGYNTEHLVTTENLAAILAKIKAE